MEGRKCRGVKASKVNLRQTDESLNQTAGEAGGGGRMRSEVGNHWQFDPNMMEERDASHGRGSWTRKWSPTFQTIVFLSNPLRTRLLHGALDRQKKRKEHLELVFYFLFPLTDGIDGFGQSDKDGSRGANSSGSDTFSALLQSQDSLTATPFPVLTISAPR